MVVNDNGGTATTADFTLTANGAGSNDISGVSPVDSGAGLLADTFALSETGPAGYASSSWVCTGGTQNGASITLGINEEATCTITNDDIAPQLIVIKHVINDSGNDATSSDFTMLVTANNASTSSFPGSESGTTITLNAGPYSVDEGSHAGYAESTSTDCVGTINIGETKTCTITNNDIPMPTRTLGFWQTHTTFTSSVFGISTWTIGSKTIWTNITSSSLFAGFYASIPKKSTGAKRLAIDQARMQMLQQWLAAKLNCQAFGCSISTKNLINNAAIAWAGTNTSSILSYASLLDAYNNSNDSLSISIQGKATPKLSQSRAIPAIPYWDLLP